MLRDTLVDPLYFAGGSIWLLPGGRSVIQFDALPDDASDAQKEYFNRYLATIASLGHAVYVGSVTEFAQQREAHREDL